MNLLLLQLLLSVLQFAVGELTDSQKRYCSQNDNGDFWKYDLTPLGKLPKPMKIIDKDWEYHIALCGEQNIEVNTDISGDAIVQTKTTDNNVEVHIIGTKIISRFGGAMWVNLAIGHGDPYNNHCNRTERKAQILFICDPDVGLGKPQLLDEANGGADFCFYMFEWSTNLVCPKNAKGTGSNKGVSAIKLLLIEFVVIVLVYVVLGVSYRRFVLGARGLEQIPNLAFWKNCKEGITNTVDKARNASTSNSNFSGVRSEGGNHATRGALNIHTGEDDDDRLIM